MHREQCMETISGYKISGTHFNVDFTATNELWLARAPARPKIRSIRSRRDREMHFVSSIGNYMYEQRNEQKKIVEKETKIQFYSCTDHWGA